MKFGEQPSLPKSARFFGFLTKSKKLSGAKKELLNEYPDECSVVFMNLRPNQKSLNGWINFSSERTCEEITRKIKQCPPKNGLRLIKPGSHVSPERSSILAKGKEERLMYQNWFDAKFPNDCEDIEASNLEKKNRFTQIRKF